MKKENVEVIDSTNKECCSEEYIFKFKDKNNEEIFIGLTQILSCLSMAEKNNLVPKIDNKWWHDVEQRY